MADGLAGLRATMLAQCLPPTFGLANMRRPLDTGTTTAFAGKEQEETAVAVGTGAGLLKEQKLQSLMKHQVLARYGMVFTQKLTQGGRLPVTLVDGYAGEGRYADGTAASAELLMKTAIADKTGTARVELVEKDLAHQPKLQALVDEYRHIAGSNRPDWLRLHSGTVEDHIADILERAQGSHLFLFLDPCGAGLHFDQVVDLHRRGGRNNWPRTEVLLNFNSGLGTRVPANALERTTPSILDSVCGPWWRDSVRRGRMLDNEKWGLALSELVEDYTKNLAAAMPNSRVIAIPVRRKHTGLPVFYLVHTTVSEHGVWAMSDVVAQATRAWRKEHDIRAAHEQLSLFDPPDVIEDFEEAERRVGANLLAISRGPKAGQPLVGVADLVLAGIGGALQTKDIGRVARELDKEKRLRLEKASRPEQYRVYPA